MKHIKLLSLSIIIYALTFPALSQSDDALVENTRGAIKEWKAYADVLKTYQGLSQYCRDSKFRDNVIVTLNNIHHYDTLVLGKNIDKSTEKDIVEFEEKYSASNFKQHLKQECKARREVEKEKKQSPGGFATGSYEAQKLVVETEVQRYINHVSKVVAHIDHDLKKSDI